jgi:NADH-quinone oxidoreductase subunit G
VPDLEFAHTVLVLGCEPVDDAPILDLRIRKGVRRRGVRLAVATARPSALDPNAETIVRYEPGGEAAFLAELADDLAAGADSELAQLLHGGGEDVVILWGEQIGAGAAAHLLRLAQELNLAGREGAGLLEIPAGANGRGLREVGAIPSAGPGYAQPPVAGRDAAAMAQASVDGDITALHLFQTDPVRDLPNRGLWEQALHAAGLVVAHASVLTEGLREHANVIFPAESHAEKEGTLVHPDGRLQRLRTAIAHPHEVRAGWSVIADIAARAGLDLRVLTSGMAWKQIAAAVPFYEGLTLEAIGGGGVRWPAREQAAALSPDERPAADHPASHQAAPPQYASIDALRLGTYRSIWAAPEVEISPALKFAVAEQVVEISPEDAQRLGIANGEAVVLSQNGTQVHGRAHVRSGVPRGSTFAAEGLASDSANALTDRLVEVHKA